MTFPEAWYLVFFLLPLPLVSSAVTLPAPTMLPVCSPAGIVPVTLITPVIPVPLLFPVPSRPICAVNPYTVVRVAPCNRAASGIRSGIWLGITLRVTI